ncbi:MAG: hypothetical protein HRU70_06045 [Phycisphaeraceae bacterium]|nr:MAG: hypothetical protein HRU70_06045 [Phycisphaeraceae bacterium]
MKTWIMSVTVAVGIAGSAFAGPTFHAVDKNKTSTVMHGGNRELTSLGFVGLGEQWTGANFLHWHDGRLTNNVGTYGWNQEIPRDVNGDDDVSGNPDRADSASAFFGEAGRTGTLREVFGPFNGYKNMSYIIDGEDNGSWTLDLFFAAGIRLNADDRADTVEIALLERGGNSDLRIIGIRADGSLTDPVMMLRGNTAQAGWTLDTLEIGGAQQVHGLGISLDSSWQDIVGFRFEARNGMNGPDLVAVGVTNNLVPTPGALALAGLGGLMLGRRRR